MPEITHPCVEDRLAVLASCDPPLADQIRCALAKEPGLAGYPASDTNALAQAQNQAQAWLQAEETRPDAVILPVPPGRAGIEALLSVVPADCRILVLERTASAAARLFLDCPIEELIRQERVKLVVSENEDWIDLQLMLMVNLPNSPFIRVCDAWAGGPDWDFYRSLLMNIRGRVRMKTFNMSTVIHLGPHWQHNTLRNLSVIVRHPGISRLDGLFRQRPALVVAAGPSLDDAIPCLKAVASGFVVIAVGTALRSLRRAGIRPDLVVTVDASRKTGPQFETQCEDLFLASSAIAFPEVLPKFRGVFSGYIDANPIGRWVSAQGDDKGMISSGGTVTVAAMDLAMRMGCNPILCVGLDLCTATDGRFHVNHSMYHGERKTGPELIPVPGNFRKSVMTTIQFSNYIEAISDYVHGQRNVSFLNVTMDGARIDGMEVILTHHIQRFARPGLNAYDTIASAHERYVSPVPPRDYADRLRAIAGQIEEIGQEAFEAIRICNRLMVAMKQPALAGTAEVHEHLDQLQALEKKMMDNKDCSVFLEMSLRPIYYLLGRKAEQKGTLADGAIEANRRSREFFEQVVGAGRWTVVLLNDAVERIERAAQREMPSPAVPEILNQTAA